MVARARSLTALAALVPVALASSSCVEIPLITDLACDLEPEAACSIQSERPPPGHCTYFVQLLSDDAASRSGEFFVIYDADDGSVVGSRASASLHRAGDEYGTHSGVWRIDVPATDGRLVLDALRWKDYGTWTSSGCNVLRRELPRCEAGTAHDASVLSAHAATVTNPALMLQNGCLLEWEIQMFGEFRDPHRY